MAVRLSRFKAGYNQLKTALMNEYFFLGLFGAETYQYGKILNVNIDTEGKSDEDYANFDVTISYLLKGLLSDDDKDITAELSQGSLTLRFLSNIADKAWTYSMKEKVWNHLYPDSVALDMTSGEVYFVSITDNGLYLNFFGRMSELELDMFKEESNEAEPYQITIEPHAMFMVIDGSEGINHLRDNLCVEFNCKGTCIPNGHKICVRHDEASF